MRVEIWSKWAVFFALYHFSLSPSPITNYCYTILWTQTACTCIGYVDWYRITTKCWTIQTSVHSSSSEHVDTACVSSSWRNSHVTRAGIWVTAERSAVEMLLLWSYLSHQVFKRHTRNKQSLIWSIVYKGPLLVIQDSGSRRNIHWNRIW